MNIIHYDIIKYKLPNMYKFKLFKTVYSYFIIIMKINKNKV